MEYQPPIYLISVLSPHRIEATYITFILILIDLKIAEITYVFSLICRLLYLCTWIAHC